MATDKKDLIFKRIENEKRCTKSRLMNFCGATADQVAEATKALEAEGKIKAHPGIREGAVIYTLPGIPKDYEGEPVKKSYATPPSKKSAKTERSVPAPREPVVDNKKKASVVGEPSPISMVIVELELRRTMIDVAIETLRALA